MMSRYFDYRSLYNVLETTAYFAGYIFVWWMSVDTLAIKKDMDSASLILLFLFMFQAFLLLGLYGLRMLSRKIEVTEEHVCYTDRTTRIRISRGHIRSLEKQRAFSGAGWNIVSDDAKIFLSPRMKGYKELQDIVRADIERNRGTPSTE
jgi:hypothetical protein